MIEEFVRNAEAAGFRVHRGEAPQIEGAGVSRALYGLADTGSVVLAASADEPRTRSLLPPAHVSLLEEDRILPGLSALFEAVGADLPSALAIVTGPSRSADIEQRLAVGVHGPGEVHVVLLPPAEHALMRRALPAPFALALVAGWLVSNVGAVASPFADAYGVSLAVVGALAAAAVATHALMQIPAGRLVDRYGARAAALAGLSILVAADGIGALAPDLVLAVAARLVIGVGTALSFVAGSDLLRTSRAPVLGQGLYGGTAMSGAGLALAVLPQVGRGDAWRVSWLSAAGLAAFGLVTVALSTTAGAVRPERRSSREHVSVIRDRRLYRLAVLYTASYGSSVLVGNWVVTFLERAARYPSSESGLAGALTLFAGILSRPLGGWLAERRPALVKRVVAAGLVAGSSGTAVLALAPPLAVGVVASAAVGIGAGIPFGPVFSGAQRLRPDRPAVAVGLVNFCANAAIVAGVPLVGLTFSLPGDGRVGLVAVACLWAAALAVLPPAGVLTPGVRRAGLESDGAQAALREDGSSSST